MKQIRFDKPEIAKVYDNPVSKGWFQNLLDTISSEVTTKVHIALEVGCGPAQYARALWRGFGTTVVGADFSWEMLQAAACRQDDIGSPFYVTHQN